MDGAPVDRISESAPLGDGQANASDFVSYDFQQDEETIARKRKKLLRSLDRPEFAGPAKAALALAVQCFTKAFAREFAAAPGELTVRHGAAARSVSPDPDQAADLIYKRAARALALGRSRGLADPGAALARAAESSVTETFEALIDVGTLDGPGGEAVQVMLDTWGQKLARLVEILDEA